MRYSGKYIELLMTQDFGMTMERAARRLNAPKNYNLVQDLYNSRTGVLNYRTGHHRMGGAKYR